MDYELNIDWSSFMETHWQKRPLLIKGGFRNFRDPISPDELAGLAMEEDVDSRMVTRFSGKWDVRHGPFEDFDGLGEKDWSILVQAVDHWHAPSAALMAPFRCLSDWRMDDLMISYSVPGGGVGPHLDQYDVFIIQGQGRRRWRVGEKIPMEQHCPHPDLLQVEPFDAIIDDEMVPGDILYIPPGFPHEGYAIEDSLNFSVGFRAPNAREMLGGFADYVIANDLGSYRYSDPDLAFRDNPALIQQNELTKLHTMMQDLLGQPDVFRRWFGEFISQTRHELDLAPPEPAYAPDEITALLTQGESLYRLSALRALRAGDTCFVNGEAINTPHIDAADALCQYPVVTAGMLGDALNDPEFTLLLAALVNSGYWYFED